MKILAVDFDGVISDSALKSLFVSHNAYCKYFGSEVKKSFGGELFTFDNWEEMKKQYKKEMDYYHRLRSYIELSGDFFAIIKIMEEQVQIKDQQEFIAYRNLLHFDYKFFRELFFQEKFYPTKHAPSFFAIQTKTCHLMMKKPGIDTIIIIDNRGIGIKHKVDLNGYNVMTIKANKNLGRTFDLSLERARNNLNMGYYDTLRAYNGYLGLKYYIMDFDEKEILSYIYQLENNKINRIAEILDLGEIKYKKQIFEEIIPKIYKILKFI